MLCPFCRQSPPESGFCCERAELEALREVVDEVAYSLAAEATTLGALDARELLLHSVLRLRQVRAA